LIKPTYLLFLIIPFLAHGFQIPKLTWTEYSDRDGVKIFKAVESVKGSDMVPIKFQTIVVHSLAKVLTVMADTPRKLEWVPQMKMAKTLNNISPYSKIEYAHYNSPWPFDDRVFLLKMEGDYYPKDKEIRIEMHSLDSYPNAPVAENVVKGVTHFGSVTLRPVLGPNGEHWTWFEMLFLTDFKGNIPNWIVKMVQTSWPKKLVRKMRNQLNKADVKANPAYKFNKLYN
jgi:hypothetical protein